MKTLKHFLVATLVVASFGILEAGAAELKSVTVQYAQGLPITFFEPVPARTTGHARLVRRGPVKVKWAEQSVPNGLSVDYVVREYSPAHSVLRS